MTLGRQFWPRWFTLTKRAGYVRPCMSERQTRLHTMKLWPFVPTFQTCLYVPLEVQDHQRVESHLIQNRPCAPRR
ncbi:uncharacterized protein TrAFT101_004824 [Trichoderma asperellum]|uniref:uncharacterized protein n=1 Tax=Trichoderma asperellum TaxID=101201 RepID=UPI00332AB60E|nr:hypothetical protein TrAFT101_004824 [Trichoderma asperellum]